MSDSEKDMELLISQIIFEEAKEFGERELLYHLGEEEFIKLEDSGYSMEFLDAIATVEATAIYFLSICQIMPKLIEPHMLQKYDVTVILRHLSELLEDISAPNDFNINLRNRLNFRINFLTSPLISLFFNISIVIKNEKDRINSIVPGITLDSLVTEFSQASFMSPQMQIMLIDDAKIPFEPNVYYFWKVNPFDNPIGFLTIDQIDFFQYKSFLSSYFEGLNNISLKINEIK